MLEVLATLILAPNPVGLVINSVILSALGLALGIMTWEVLRNRLFELKNIGNIPRALDSPLKYAVQKRDCLLGFVDANSLAAKRIQDIYFYAENLSFSRRDMPALDVEDLESSRMSAGFVRFCLHGLLLLGLLGTFLGLTHIAANFGDAIAPLKSGTMTELQEELRMVAEGVDNSLKGAFTAFGTSICGLFATVALSLASIPLTSSRYKLLDAIDRVTEERIIPILVARRDEVAVEQAAEQLTEATHNVNDYLERAQIIIEGLESQYSDVKVASEVFRECTVEISKERGAVLQAIASLGTLLNAEAADKVAVVDQLGVLARATELAGRQLESAHEGISVYAVESGKHYGEIISLLREHVDGLSGELLGVREKQVRSESRVREALSELVEAAADAARRSESLALEVRAAAEQVGTNNDVLEEAMQRTADVEIAVSRVTDTTAEMAASIGSTGQRIDDLVGAVEEVRDQSKKLLVSVRKLDDGTASGSFGRATIPNDGGLGIGGSGRPRNLLLRALDRLKGRR